MRENHYIIKEKAHYLRFLGLMRFSFIYHTFSLLYFSPLVFSSWVLREREMRGSWVCICQLLIVGSIFFRFRPFLFSIPASACKQAICTKGKTNSQQTRDEKYFKILETGWCLDLWCKRFCVLNPPPFPSSFSLV